MSRWSNNWNSPSRVMSVVLEVGGNEWGDLQGSWLPTGQCCHTLYCSGRPRGHRRNICLCAVVKRRWRIGEEFSFRAAFGGQIEVVSVLFQRCRTNLLILYSHAGQSRYSCSVLIRDGEKTFLLCAALQVMAGCLVRYWSEMEKRPFHSVLHLGRWWTFFSCTALDFDNKTSLSVA